MHQEIATPPLLLLDCTHVLFADTLNDKGDELLWQLYGKEDGSQVRYPD